MSRFFLFANDPGGANVVGITAQGLRDAGHTVLLLGTDLALKRYAEVGAEAHAYQQYFVFDQPETIQKFLASWKPHVVVTGTSAQGNAEREIWRIAGCMDVPSAAILDQWMNVSQRFIPPGSMSEAPKHSPASIPNRILTMDDEARRIMIAGGIPEARICVSGHPYLEYIAARHGGRGDRDRKGTPGNLLTVLFASEPVSLDYGGPEAAIAYWGFNEYTSFDAVVQALRGWQARTGRSIRLIAKLHPRDETGKYQVWNDQSAMDFEIIEMRDLDQSMVGETADLILGLSSMFLLESVVMGIPTASLMVGLKRDNPFILDHLNILSSLRSPEALASFLDAVAAGTYRCPEWRIADGAIRKTVHILEGLACPN
ncbi:MAG: hypothetical protein ACM3QZ_02375 [Solirubrobacterales bacterium]